MPAANALLSDNVHNIAGGGANIHTDNTCVEKVGDTAHVKFMAQHQPLAMSSNHVQTSASGTLAIPADMKNVKIRIKAVGHVEQTYSSNIESDVFDEPIEVPIEEGAGDLAGPALFRPVFENKEGSDTYEFIGGKESIEQNIADGAKLVRHHQADLQDEDGVVNNATFPFSSFGSSDLPWYGHHDIEYDFYEFGSLYVPLTFEIEGDIDTIGNDTFVTAAVSNLGWKSSSEDGAGTYEQGAQAMTEYAEFRPGGLPPAIPEDEEMIQAYKDKLTDAGLDISPYIAPTSEIPGSKKYSYIGSDIRPSARGDAGENYTRIFVLHGDVYAYGGQVPRSAEDGADVTAAHVTLCPAEETPETDVPETDVPDTETPETETPETETPETETPETETPETETPETETPETETPETETPETETPETETPETETPETETPETETPETETPETETPETETPETKTPETETPEIETPETETPNTDTPETDVPETETPETETPNTDTSETDTPAPAPSNDGGTGSRTLASTGASVIGIGVVALVLIGAGIFLSRRKKD